MDQLLIMSNAEITRLEVMLRLRDKHLKQIEAARMLGISVRQVKCVFRAYNAHEAAGLVSVVINSIFMLRTSPETVAERGRAKGW